MIDVMKYLTAELKKINPRVFNGNANEGAIFPYIVFYIPTITEVDESQQEVILEIDIWDISRDGYDATSNVEILTNRIEKIFKENRHIDQNQLLVFTKINRLSLRDTDTNVKRRQLRYAIKYYNRNQ